MPIQTRIIIILGRYQYSHLFDMVSDQRLVDGNVAVMHRIFARF